MKKFRVVARYEFEMVGKDKNDVMGALDVLFDSLVECHSNAHTDSDPDMYENFTGKYPVKLSCKAYEIKDKK